MKTNTKITYHNGPVMQGHSNVYLIWYGGWIGWPEHDVVTQDLIELFVIGIGPSQYLQINVAYKDAIGNGPSGGIRHSAALAVTYTHARASWTLLKFTE